MCVETSPNRVGKHKARNSTNYFVGLAKLPVVQNKKVDFSGLPLLRTFKNIESNGLHDINNILACVCVRRRERPSHGPTLPLRYTAHIVAGPVFDDLLAAPAGGF